MRNQNSFQTIEAVKEYYGRVLKSNKDLKTSACCLADSMPSYLRPLLKDIHPEVQEKFYGCGSPIPLELEGKTVLDLGSGSGRDSYLLSRLVGPQGKVIGIDMTEEQLQTASNFRQWHADRYGYEKSNVEFLKGYIEDLESLGIRNNSIDIVISNCVINLSPDKSRVFREIMRVLKPGGELYFSDVFSDRRLSHEIKNDPILLGECLGGALYSEDFRRIMADVGARDFRIVSDSVLQVDHEALRSKLGQANFFSRTIRAFKLELEDRCEDYGQVAVYKGTLKDSPSAFLLDDHHLFESHRPHLVCSNTALMLSETRFAEHFEIRGDLSRHFGLFDCSSPASLASQKSSGACC